MVGENSRQPVHCQTSAGARLVGGTGQAWALSKKEVIDVTVRVVLTGP